MVANDNDKIQGAKGSAKTSVETKKTVKNKRTKLYSVVIQFLAML